MKTRIVLAAALVLAGYLFAPVLAAAAEPLTLKGEIVDLWCYLPKEAKGAAHKPCSEACIKAGAPMGLLTSDGKLYVILSDHTKNAAAYDAAKGLAGETVDLKGTEATRNAVPGVVVESVSKAK